ncbi:MAG: Eco57I restriction-modification methylase domain-containing protein, partial [Prevotellaceae bacterium]|nr:Eco57I restriction-modification methylase domain-containing protein [Prevotellaceae bacterium]
MELKSYLSRKFEGRESFLENIVFPIFGEERFEDMYDVDALDNEDLQAMAQRTGIKSAILYGLVQIGTTEIYIYDVTVSDRVIMRRNRVGIQQLIRKIMETYTSAFIIFHYEDSDSWDWRFSFCQKDNKEVTEAKRYTFLLGPGQSCRTAADNFQKLIDKRGEISREDIVKAFDVEALSKEFFDKYKAQYEKFCNYIYDNCDDESLFGKEFAEWDEKLIRDYVKKLLGRIVFLHFLQMKGWLGVPFGKEWGEGDTQFMKHLFEASTQEQKENYLDCVLEPLFAGALNTQRPNDIFDLNVDGYRTTRIPYLNGGLFERDALDEPKSTFPASYFEELFEFFYQYNFTIDENDPNDAEVGIDPEMLGRIFENLLEDNKDKGAFYTPKEIVQYMCRESLIAYLTTCVMKKQGENHKPEDEIKESVRKLLNKPEDIVPRMTKEHLKDFDSYIRNVKICDPAIGSGAFPMGLLNELVRCRVFINAWAKDEKGNLLEGDYAALKTEIISNNIYGVDIEKGAIDIARLRFWLSIIVDERNPHVLPNFDYKFMQGNSLIPTFDGKFINLDTKGVRNDVSKKLIAEKKELYRLKQLHYNASGNEKYDLDIKIKRSILRLIAIRLGYESRSWYKNNVTQTSLAFDDDSESTSFDTIRHALPEDKQKAIELVEILYKKLNDNNIPVSTRSQIDICFFDWHIMFTEVFDNGGDGFDIVIGNPPYGAKLSSEIKKELKKIYTSAVTIPNLQKGSLDTFSLFIDLGYVLLHCNGNAIFIVPLSITASDSMSGIHRLLIEKCDNIYISSYGDRPRRIFESAEQQVSIVSFIKTNQRANKIMTTHINKRYSDESLWILLDNLKYVNSIQHIRNGRIPKIGDDIEKRILDKLKKCPTTLKDLYADNGCSIFFR